MGNMDDANKMFKLLFAGKLQPVIDSVWPLTQYRQALEHMLAGDHFGKIVIDVQSASGSEA